MLKCAALQQKLTRVQPGEKYVSLTTAEFLLHDNCVGGVNVNTSHDLKFLKRLQVLYNWGWLLWVTGGWVNAYHQRHALKSQLHTCSSSLHNSQAANPKEVLRWWWWSSPLLLRNLWVTWRRMHLPLFTLNNLHTSDSSLIMVIHLTFYFLMCTQLTDIWTQPMVTLHLSSPCWSQEPI